MESQNAAQLTNPRSAQFVSEDEQVAAAMHPQVVGPLLLHYFASRIDFEGRKEYLSDTKKLVVPCRVLDMKYEPGDYCILLYQLADQMIVGTYQWKTEDNSDADPARTIPNLGMQVYLFPNDPSLPGLMNSLDPAIVTAALKDTLAECRSGSAHILRCEINVMRFRPGKRCTVRLDIWLRSSQSAMVTKKVLFGKIYHDLEKAGQVYQEMQQLSNAFPGPNGRLTLAFPHAFLPDLAMVLQEPVEGIPLDLFLDCNSRHCDRRGMEGTLQAARALAALHTCGLEAGRQRPIEGELKRFKHRAKKISRINPRLGEEITALSDDLSTWLAQLESWGAVNSLVHGDCKPSQFLIAGKQVALLDFDHCGMADPAGDVGTFLATLRQAEVQQRLKNHGKASGSVHWLPELMERFLDEYCEAGGLPAGFKMRATWYMGVALLRKAIRSFERSPFTSLPSALIIEARQVLMTLPPSDSLSMG